MTTITKEKIESTLPTLRAAFNVVLFLLRVTTYFVLAIVLFSFFSSKAGAFVAYSLTAIFTVAGGYAIDGLLDKLLPLAATRGRAENRDLAQFHRIARFLAAALLIVTGTLSWWAMPEVAEVAVREVDTTEEMETIQQLSADTRAAMEQKGAELEKAELTERTRIARAEQEGRALVADAIAAGPARWQELYNDRNGWFLKQNRGDIGRYLASIRQAEKGAAELVQKEHNLTERIRHEKSLLEANRATKTDAAIQGIASTVETRVKRREMRLSNLSNILLIMDISWMIIAAVLAYLIGLVDGHDLRERKSAIGLIFEVATHAEQSALRSVELNLIGRRSGGNSPGSAQEKQAPPHVSPARNASDDFELKRQVETLMAKVETLMAKVETFQRENETVSPETVETVSRETETVNGPKSVSVSVGETVSFDLETVKGAVKEAVREVAPETVETVRETVETEMKRKPAVETVRVETVKHVPPVRKKVETFQVETVRKCLNCDGSMKGKRSTAKFCSTECKNEHHNAKR